MLPRTPFKVLNAMPKQTTELTGSTIATCKAIAAPALKPIRIILETGFSLRISCMRARVNATICSAMNVNVPLSSGNDYGKHF